MSDTSISESNCNLWEQDVIRKNKMYVGFLKLVILILKSF